jgi:DNA invertase Pin-like site-specific DNA recombinase
MLPLLLNEIPLPHASPPRLTTALKAMFQIMGVFAEFERSMIVERVRAGVAGTKSGKAFGRPRVPAETEQRIRDALATPGRPGFHKIAAQFGVATGTVQRIATGT